MDIEKKLLDQMTLNIMLANAFSERIKHTYGRPLNYIKGVDNSIFIYFYYIVICLLYFM